VVQKRSAVVQRNSAVLRPFSRQLQAMEAAAAQAQMRVQ